LTTKPQNPIRAEDLQDFVRCYAAEDRRQRKATSHFRQFKYAEIVARDKASLDIQWQQQSASPTNKDTPQEIMQEILRDLEEAMKAFATAEEASRQ
jgi:type I restriction enzyme M protein